MFAADASPAQHRHAAHYTLNRLSASSASALAPGNTDLGSVTTRVSRGSLVFPPTGAPRIGDGDHITVELSSSNALGSTDLSAGDEEDTSLLQIQGTSTIETDHQRFRAVPTFLANDPFLQSSCRKDGSYEPPTLERDINADNAVLRPVRGATELHADLQDMFVRCVHQCRGHRDG